LPTHIHIVDDEPGVRDVVGRFLSRAGYVVSCSATGAEAVAALLHQPADLVLLDVSLPDGDGVALCARLKGDIALTTVPILLLTVFDTPELRGEALHAGAAAVLGKPFGFGDLIASVAEHLAPAATVNSER
jgi:two-component system, OmpR family, response regulator